MRAIIDTTVLLHLNYHDKKMRQIIKNYGITEIVITRVSYLELLAGASENVKLATRKFLGQFLVLEFDKKSAGIGNKLAMRYRVSARNSKDFLIACTAMANKLPLLTENDKDFAYNGLTVLPYRIAGAL